VASRALLNGTCINLSSADHLQIFDAMSEVGDKELRGDRTGM
jgi:hypothetical protein